MLKVWFGINDNQLLMKVLQQDEDKINFSYNKYLIRTESCPQPTHNALYVRGSNKLSNNAISGEVFNNRHEAVAAMNKWKEVIRAYNNSLEYKQPTAIHALKLDDQTIAE